MAIVHWLLIYDLDDQRLVSQQRFSDALKAAAAYAEAEETHLRDSNVEIVLVGADSIETIEQTHGSYFKRGYTAAASPYLTGV